MTPAIPEQQRRPDGHRNLLILRLSALGDVIHTLPAAVALRAALPETAFAWAVEAPYAELVELIGEMPAIRMRMKRWGRSPVSSRKEIGNAWKSVRRFDLAADFQGLIKSAAVGWLSGASLRFGFDAASIREKAALAFINRKIAVDPTLHVIDQNLQLAGGIAAALGALLPSPLAHPAWERFPADPGATLTPLANAIVLLPGAGKANKIWPSANFARLAREIGPEALAVWGPGERALAEATGARLAPPTSLRELAWILKHARLVIGGDTGPLHLAAALGAPVVGLYGPTNPRRNGPYGQLDHCVSRFDSTKLIGDISVDDVMDVISRLVQR